MSSVLVMFFHTLSITLLILFGIMQQDHLNHQNKFGVGSKNCFPKGGQKAALSLAGIKNLNQKIAHSDDNSDLISKTGWG